MDLRLRDETYNVGEDEDCACDEPFGYLKTKIIERGCPELQELDDLRTKGYEDETLRNPLNKFYRDMRKITDKGTKKVDKWWFFSSKGVMAELIKETRLLRANTKVDRFLDLGCCPGGFSQCILKKCSKAQGVGVSLKVTDGGNSLIIRLPHPRFEMHWGDLTYFDICAPASALVVDKTRLSPTPFKCRREFNLAILDGHHRRPQESVEDTHKWDIDRLLVAQLIIALESLTPGGTLIVTLKRIEWSKTARILYMLDKLSNTVDVFKPSGSHKTRSIFYAVVRGVGKGEEGTKRDFHVQNLKLLWWELTFGGPSGTGRWIHQPDLDFIIDTETLAEAYLDRLMDLGKGTWSRQRDGLKDQFEKQNKTKPRAIRGSKESCERIG